MLTQAMIAPIGRHSIGDVATVALDGAPAISREATFVVAEPGRLAYADIRSSGTTVNLARDPRVEIVFADPSLLHRFENRWPDLFALLEGVVTIDCQDAAMVSSPSYDVVAEPDALAEDRLHRFAKDLGDIVGRRNMPGSDLEREHSTAEILSINWGDE